MTKTTIQLTSRASVLGAIFLVSSLLIGLGAPRDASALDKGQIEQMAKIGLDESAIKGAIDAAGDELMLTEAELGELAAAGVSADVLEHLRRTGHVSSPSEAEPGGAIEPAPGGDLVPGIEPGPAPGAESGGASLDEEGVARLIKILRGIETRRRETETELNRGLPPVESAIASLEAGTNRMGAAKTCLAYLAGYRALLKQIESDTAEITAMNVNPEKLGISLETDPSRETARGEYLANFCLAKALYEEGIFSGASRSIRQVLAAGAGPDRERFKEAFYMLEDVSAKVGYRPPSLGEITAVNVGNFDQGFRDDFHYYFGKFFFDYEQMENASQMLSRVSTGAEDYPEARYLNGLAVLGSVSAGAGRDDDLRKKAGDALKAFEDAIVSAEAERGGNEEILQLGYLALARTWYELGFYDVALYYYQKLPTESSRNADAKFEQAWTYFLKNDHKKALGVFHLLGSPYYEKWYYPDVDLLEATVYLNLCKFEKSKLALAELDQKYLSQQGALQSYVAELEQAGPRAAWERTVASFSAEGRRTSKLPELFSSAVLNDVRFFNVYKQVEALKAERDALRANMASLGEFGEFVLGRVEQSLAEQEEEGGKIVLAKLSEIDNDLSTLSIQATQISFDIDSEEKEELQQRLVNPDYESTRVDRGTTLLIVADDWHPWPFEGEYWVDEVANYRSTLRTECVEQ